MNTTPTTELSFPVECHLRVIAEDRKGMAFVLETVLLELGVTAPLERANTSRQGKYVSFALSTVVEDHDTLRRIDRELRQIEGVRMVL